MDAHENEKENSEKTDSTPGHSTADHQSKSSTHFKISPISQNPKAFEHVKTSEAKRERNEIKVENGEAPHLTPNTEYLPTKCRITKPPPPKPATNPQQFIKVGPCPLYQKAFEQIKKVEEIKKERREIRDETEDWQQNLDNWKSCRRKRQEHIIERVVEVKKLEQEGHEKTRRKSKTFSEMIEDRSRGRHKFAIPIYDDDSNDLSDYGIGSSSSKTNSIRDDTDDSSSILDEKDSNSFDSPSNKGNSSGSNQSQSEDECNISPKNTEKKENLINNNSSSLISSYSGFKSNILTKSRSSVDTKYSENFLKETSEQYTYEGAIQDYRSRIQSKINVDESIFSKTIDVTKCKEYSEAQTVLPKGEIFKRKGLFETEKQLEIETTTSRRLSEDFANSRSIKDRLRSLEKSTDQSIKFVDKNDIQVSVKQRLKNFNKQCELDNQNNNSKSTRPVKISNYILDKSSSQPNLAIKEKSLTWKNNEPDRSSSPETEMYMNKLNMFSRDLDNLMNGKPSNINEHEEYLTNLNYPPSTSSTELVMLSSDREDSGIHTADVSCSVSQAGESVDTDNDNQSNTIPNCIEKLTKEKDSVIDDSQELDISTSTQLDPKDEVVEVKNVPKYSFSKEYSINTTIEFLEFARRDASENLTVVVKTKDEVIPPSLPVKPKPVYENVQLKTEEYPIEFITDDLFPSATSMEPPKVKPPPPPPPEDEHSGKPNVVNLKRLNSAKRIKKEIHIKRSSFLGLDEPTDDQIDPELPIDKPPDINTFLQKESKLEKSLYKKMQEENRIGMLSKVESQDSGLDIDRGRLSSDTWVSSVGDSSTPSHERQDSEQTNSFTSEEEEIIKKEREIIAMIEKEEKSRDVDFVNNNETIKSPNFLQSEKQLPGNYEPSLGSEQFKKPYFPQSPDYLEDQDSEVLKVEQELIQLEQEELERQRDDLLFRESRAKARMQSNRHSLENICDEIYPGFGDSPDYHRKSMPELQHMSNEYRKSVTDMPNAYNRNLNVDLQYCKSLSDIQNAYNNKTVPAQQSKTFTNEVLPSRKSMPDLQHDSRRSAFKSPAVNRQPILPGRPLRPKKDPLFTPISSESTSQPRQLSKPSLQALSAVPRPRHIPNDNWIQPKANPEAKSYNQHWLYQEAELRRITDQQKNTVPSRNWQKPRQDKHLPDSIIQSLTQRVQKRANSNDRISHIRRSENSPSKQQHSYLGHPPQTVGHALRMPYAPPIAMEESQDRMLSVSGKKKCSYCSNELGRGAAMIIESLCLFYHMECFKCCVCHSQLGDGLMGTDVRVRNQKLHCHNCYSSDDGIKFSCV